MTHAETGEEKTVKADFEGASVMVYSVCCEHNGKIYGGGFQPASTFELDPETGHITDLGRLSTGRIQVYDMLSHPKGIFLSSYTGSNLDFYKPSSGEKKPIATLSETHEQERAQQFALGPDGRIYTGTIPIKGLLGGAVVRLDPGDFSILVWRNVVPNQSFKSVVAVDRTGEIFFASSISGGTSAIPSEGEACVMLWDIQREEMSWNAKPIPGATDYSRAVMAANGLIYGLAGSERSEALFGRPGEAYYVFDPTRREVVYTGVLPVGGVHWPGMVPAPAGPEGLIIGLGEDAVFAIDPSDHSARILARHDSIPQSRGMFATASGVLYYGSGPFLMRVDLYPGR
jgi:outer membrane protein assembly factor BamB